MKKITLSLNTVLLLASLLLIGQTTSLWHQTQFEKHLPGELCSFCLQSGTVDSPAGNSTPQLPAVVINHPALISYVPQFFITPAIPPRQARAPPHFS